MSFRIGQRVVCVDATLRCKHRLPASIWIANGEVYTIRWIGEFPWVPDRMDGAAVRLQEISRRLDDGEFADYPFALSRFRPVIERETDISALTELLNPLNHKPLPDVTPVKAPARV